MTFIVAERLDVRDSTYHVEARFTRIGLGIAVEILVEKTQWNTARDCLRSVDWRYRTL